MKFRAEGGAGSWVGVGGGKDGDVGKCGWSGEEEMEANGRKCLIMTETIKEEEEEAERRGAIRPAAVIRFHLNP